MIASLVTQGNSSDTWYIDSGASQHMTYNKNFFNNLEESKGARIFLGDDSSHAIEGVGSISLKGNDVKKWTITYVNLVPNLTKNILSVSQITQHGYKVEFYSNKCLIKNINVDKKAYVTIAQSSTNELWYQIYSHLNYQSLSMLSKMNMADGLPWIKVNTNVCEGCKVGKQHRDDSFERSTWSESKSLELIHSDLCGPMNPTSRGS